MNTPFYIVAQAGFLLVTVLFVGLLVRELKRGAAACTWPEGRKRRYVNTWIAAVVAWAALVAAWSLSGAMADFSRFPMNLLPVILVPLIAVVILGFSKSTGEVLRHIPPDNLVRLQSFRVFVELLLWMLFIEGLLPEQMTFEGRNFDILAGLTAPAVAFLMMKGQLSRTGIVIWNILSLGLLLNIVTIAILSTPSPWRIFMNEPANYIVTRFPVSFLPGLLVPLAYYLHVFSLKQVLAAKTTSPVHPVPGSH